MCIIHLYNTSFMCIIHLYNTSLIPIFTEHKSYLWYKNFFVLHLLFYFPKIKNFQITSLELFTSVRLSLFQCLKIAVVKDFCFQNFLLLLFLSLLLKMNSHFNLDYSELLHFWFTHPPMLFHNSLTTTRLKSSTC